MRVELLGARYSRWLNKAGKPWSLREDGVALERSQRWRGKKHCFLNFGGLYFAANNNELALKHFFGTRCYARSQLKNFFTLTMVRFPKNMTLVVKNIGKMC